jgi:hypothetical protein
VKATGGGACEVIEVEPGREAEQLERSGGLAGTGAEGRVDGRRE